MPSDRLNAQLRQIQLKLQRDAVRGAAGLWRLLDPEELPKTSPPWVKAMERMINAQRVQSSKAAVGFILANHTLETGERLDPRKLELADKIDHDQVTKGLMYAGPGLIDRNLKRGDPPKEATEKAFSVVAGTTSRYVADAGRESIRKTGQRIPQIVGWARYTGPNPCAFCAMLASRGPVYHSRTTATKTDRGDGEGFQPYHNNCSCWSVPVYTSKEHGDDDWPGKAREWEALWKTATKGYHGQDAINAFRRAYEAQRPSRYH